METHFPEPPEHMTLLCTIQQSVLKGLLTVAATKDPRPWVKAIHLYAHADVLFATDGRVVLLVKQAFCRRAPRLTISRSMCEKALRRTRDPDAQITVRTAVIPKASGHWVRLSTVEWTLCEPAVPCDGVDYLRLIRYPASDECHQVDPTLLARLALGMRRVAGRADLPVHVVEKGNAPALLVCPRADILGLAQPTYAVGQPRLWAPQALRRFGVWDLESQQADSGASQTANA